MKQEPQFGTKEFNDLANQYFSGKPKQEIKLEDVFNDEKKQGLKEFIDNHKQETLEEAVKNAYKKYSVKGDALSLDEQIQRSGGFILGFKEGAKWQQEQIVKSEFLQKLRATLSDAEARRLIFETFKNK